MTANQWISTPSDNKSSKQPQSYCPLFHIYLIIGCNNILHPVCSPRGSYNGENCVLSFCPWHQADYSRATSRKYVHRKYYLDPIQTWASKCYCSVIDPFVEFLAIRRTGDLTSLIDGTASHKRDFSIGLLQYFVFCGECVVSQ
jgi:hypothetical protein